METATILRAADGGTDRYGNAVDDWVNATETVVEVLGWGPRGETEDRADGRQGAVQTGVMYLPTNTDILTTDWVSFRDQLYAVDGTPTDWRNPWTGRRPGLEVNLRRVDG